MDIEKLAERCMVAESCLPDAQYRTQLCKLHQEMLDEIARLRAEAEAAKSEASRYFDSWKRMTLKARAIHIESLRYRKSMIEILDAAIDAARGGK